MGYMFEIVEECLLNDSKRPSRVRTAIYVAEYLTVLRYDVWS
jgi:hypothetical protein